MNTIIIIIINLYDLTALKWITATTIIIIIIIAPFKYFKCKEAEVKKQQIVKTKSNKEANYKK